MQTRSIRVRGCSMPIIESFPSASGAGAEEAVVFVHGNPGSSRDWEALVPEVGRFARALAMDMPGFGRADKPADFDYTVDGYAAQLAATLEQLGVRRAHLVLHDFGGPWGLAWAAAHPQALASVSLFNTGYLPDYRWHYLARIWRTPLLGELFQAVATRAAFGRLLRHGNPRGLPRDFVDRMYADYDRGTRRAVLRLYRATGDVSARAQALAAVLRPLQLPALVVWGRHDPYLPVEYAQRQRELFADAQVHVLEDSGHWPFADHPQAACDLLLGFLRRTVGPAAAGVPPGAV